MTTLHTINRSWHSDPRLFEKQFLASPGDTVLLIEDAVVSLQSPIALASFLAKCTADGIQVAALEEDLLHRGIDSAYNTVSLITPQGFVELVIRHEKQIAW